MGVGQRDRRLTRWVDEHILEDIQRRIRAQPEKLARRKGPVEHPLGTIKRSTNQGYFLTRGLPKARTEMSLTVLVYNLKRAINTRSVGVPRLLHTLARVRAPILPCFNVTPSQHPVPSSSRSIYTATRVVRRKGSGAQLAEIRTKRTGDIMSTTL